MNARCTSSSAAAAPTAEMTYSAVTLRSGGVATVSASPLKSMSEAKTMLASAARDSTACRASPALSAVATGVTETPAPLRTSVEYSPHDDWGAHRTTFTLGLARSSRLLTPAGLPTGTMIVIWLVANLTGSV